MIPFLYLFNVLLLIRLPLYLRDDRLSGRKAVLAGAVQAVSLAVFVPGWAVAALALLVIALNLAAWRIEAVGRGPLPARRLLLLGLYAAAFSVVCSEAFGLQFRPDLQHWEALAREYFLPAKITSLVHWKPFHAGLLGALLCLNEANLLVRFIIEKLMLRPEIERKTGSLGAPQKEYNRGRIIGLLERLILFILVMQNQFTALGFVVTAKTIARFKNLDDREFAEYFIVGTLLSVVSAGGIALVIHRLFF
jgi:hypothetical protein